MWQRALSGSGGGGALGDYTQFKQGTFTTDNSGSTTVSDVGFKAKHLVLVPRTQVSPNTKNIIIYDELSPNVASNNIWNVSTSTFRSGVIYAIGGYTATGYSALDEINSTGFKIQYTDSSATWDYYAYG